ncbi:MAG: sulfite exporter TauE/SafE family protein [Verrucomicrobia bacterium]|nr:sulfite exporter TauE/SafE family protein [Verrucomicrobiota bacterium]
MNFEPWQIALAVLGALLVGISKTGMTGIGILFVAIFSSLLPARQATGLVLPLLIFGDVVAVAVYRKHACWSHVWRLLPWTAAGVVIGYLALLRIDDHQAGVLIGTIILGLAALHVWRRRGASAGVEVTEHGVWFAPLIGVLAGFTTLVANAAGPLMAIYLLAMCLPKMEYVGTGAVFFLLLNCFKVPFMMHLGLITAESFRFNLLLAPAVLAGAWLGWWFLRCIPQRLFENLALGLGVAAGIRLLLH